MSDTVKRALDASLRMRKERANGGRLGEINSYLDSFRIEDTPEARKRLRDLSEQKYFNGAESMTPSQQYQFDRLSRSYNAAPQIGDYEGESLPTWDEWAGQRMQQLQHGIGDQISRGNFAGGGKVERILDALGFYSKGREAAAAAPQKMSPEAWQNYLLGSPRGVKASELKHADWEGQTKGIRSLSQTDAADLLQSRAPKIQEKVFREEDGPRPHYRTYTLGDPGEDNYTERLLHLPNGTFGNEDYIAPHFASSGTPNILAHIRTVDRHLPGDLPLFGQRGPGKMLHIEEAQSDMGQQGRSEGWRPSQDKIDDYNERYNSLSTGINDRRDLMNETKARLMREAAIPTYDELTRQFGDKPFDEWQVLKSQWNRDIADKVARHPDYIAARDAHDELLRQMRMLPTINEDGPPWHPLVADTNAWNDIAIKRALKVAAEGKYNSIGVSPGDVQFNRWDQEGLRDIYDNKFIPSLQSSLRKMDKAAGQRSITGIGEEWHVTRNGDREDEWGNNLGRYDRRRDAEREAESHNQSAMDDYMEYHGDRDPDMEHFEGDYFDTEKAHKAELPTFNMTDEAAEKINREGFSYFADGGSVGDDDLPMFSDMRAPESITGRSPYGRGHPERTLGNEPNPLQEEYAARAPDSAVEQSRYAGDKLLGPGRDLPQGETYMSAGPTGLGRASTVVPNLGNYFMRQGEAAHEGMDTMKQGWNALKNGDIIPGIAGMGMGAMGYAASPITGAERVLVRDPYLNATGNLKDANAAETAADFAIFGGLRGALPHGMTTNPTSAFQTNRARPNLAPAAAAGAGAVGMTANSDEAQAIVPPNIAKALQIAKRAGESALARDIAGASGGKARIDDDGMLRLLLQRYQKPAQEGSESPRGGVFYLPQGDPRAHNYNGKGGWLGGESMYGGPQKITGETAFANPYFVRSSTGGSAPEKTYAEMFGKSALRDMQNDVQHYAWAGNGQQRWVQAEAARKFLEKYAPELTDYADHVADTSNRGNRMKYALQEAAVGSALRNAGHDGMLSYGNRRSYKWPTQLDSNGNAAPIHKRGDPFINEVFDVREDRYPSPDGNYSVWDHLKGDE